MPRHIDRVITVYTHTKEPEFDSSIDFDTAMAEIEELLKEAEKLANCPAMKNWAKITDVNYCQGSKTEAYRAAMARAIGQATQTTTNYYDHMVNLD